MELVEKPSLTSQLEEALNKVWIGLGADPQAMADWIVDVVLPQVLEPKGRKKLVALALDLARRTNPRNSVVLPFTEGASNVTIDERKVVEGVDKDHKIPVALRQDKDTLRLQYADRVYEMKISILVRLWVDSLRGQHTQAPNVDS